MELSMNPNSAVPSVMADRDDTGVLENLRKTLAMRYTTYFRCESLAETNILYEVCYPLTMSTIPQVC